MLTRSVAILVGVLLVQFAAAGELPRYRFSVGQELTFVAQNKLDRLKAMSKDETVTWTVWVVAKAGDDGWKLVARRNYSARYTDPSRKGASLDFDALHQLDLFPDGRLVFDEALETNTSVFTDLRAFLPMLPRDEKQVQEGYEEINEHFDEHCRYRIVKHDGNRWAIEFTPVGLAAKIYLIDSKSVCTVDAGRGLPIEATTHSEQTSLLKCQMTGSLRLTSVQDHGPEWAMPIAAETERYFSIQHSAAKSRWEATAEDSSIDKTLQDLKSARTQSKFEVFQKGLDEGIRSVEREIELRKQKESVTSLLGKTVPWATTDLEGKPVKLSDFKDKVVVLDYWYRGCFWCVRSMPQLNQLVEHYKDKPVVFLGMNIDEDDEDARFVVKKMDLQYRTLKGGRARLDYGVNAFPTLLILNEKGIVCDAYIGYEPNLKGVLIKKIDKLLAQPR